MSHWLKRVIDMGDKGIHYAIKMHNHYMILQKEIEKEAETRKDFSDLYKITYPKFKSVLKLSRQVWEKELALSKEDHELPNAWLFNYEFKKGSWKNL